MNQNSLEHLHKHVECRKPNCKKKVNNPPPKQELEYPETRNPLELREEEAAAEGLETGAIDWVIPPLKTLPAPTMSITHFNPIKLANLLINQQQQKMGVRRNQLKITWKFVAEEAGDDDLGKMRGTGAPTANHSHPHIGQNRMRIVIERRWESRRCTETERDEEEMDDGDVGQLFWRLWCNDDIAPREESWTFERDVRWVPVSKTARDSWSDGFDWFLIYGNLGSTDTYTRLELVWTLKLINWASRGFV